MYKRLYPAMILVGIAVLGTGCSKSWQGKDIDQSKMCVASTDQQAMNCRDGELILARLNPESAKYRAYNVLNTVALYCDTNYPIVQNTAGVMCVMTHKRVDQISRGNKPRGQSSSAN